jgi:hypothetical protein
MYVDSWLAIVGFRVKMFYYGCIALNVSEKEIAALISPTTVRVLSGKSQFRLRSEKNIGLVLRVPAYSDS